MRLSKDNICSSFSANICAGAASLSQVFDVSNANGLLKERARSNIFPLFVKGGFETI